MEGSRAARGALGELMRWERARLKAEIQELNLVLYAWGRDASPQLGSG